MESENIEILKKIPWLYFDEIIVKLNKTDLKYMFNVWMFCKDIDTNIKNMKMSIVNTNITQVPWWVIKKKIVIALENTQLEYELSKYMNKKDINNEWEYIWTRIMNFYESNDQKKR